MKKLFVTIFLIVVMFSVSNFVAYNSKETRNLSIEEKIQVENCIKLLKSDKNYKSLGNQIENLFQKNKIVIDYSLDKDYDGKIIPCEIIGRKIRLNSNIFKYSVYDVTEVIVHEYIHYKQNDAFPIVMQILGGWYNILDNITHVIACDDSIFFPTSFEDSAYKISQKIRNNLERGGKLYNFPF